jgi:methylamine--corrinoid protein Co-methyltransferase
MSISQANDIANKLIPTYEEKLGTPPKGQSFRECYDIASLTPTDEWQKIYDTVKEEVIKAGIPLD